MNRPVRTGVPFRVTSETSMTPRDVVISTRRPAFVASMSYFTTPAPESTTTSTRSPRMARGQVLRLLIEIPLRLSRELLERFELDPAALEGPRAGDPAVDEERAYRLRDLDVEDAGSMALGQDLGSPGVNEERRLPRPQEPRRRLRFGVRQRRALGVEQLTALSVAEAPKAQPFERRRERLRRQTGEALHVFARRRAERAEIPAHEVVDRVVLRNRRRSAEPVLGEREHVGAPALPGAGRRHPHEVDPHLHAVPRRGVDAELRDELVATARPVGEERSQTPRHRLNVVTLIATSRRREPPLAARSAHGLGEQWIVPHGNDVDGRPHERSLDHGSSFEGASEVVAAEPLEPRPQADVR